MGFSNFDEVTTTYGLLLVLLNLQFIIIFAITKLHIKHRRLLHILKFLLLLTAAHFLHRLH